LRICPRWACRVVAGVFLAAVGFATEVEAFKDGRCASGRCEVRWERSLLSVRADNAPLQEVVDEIARVTGIRVRCEGTCSEPVSGSMTRVTLERALRSLLSSLSYCVVFEGAEDTPATPTQLLVLSEKARDARFGVPQNQGNGDGPAAFLPAAPESGDPFAEERKDQEAEKNYLATQQPD